MNSCVYMTYVLCNHDRPVVAAGPVRLEVVGPHPNNDDNYNDNTINNNTNNYNNNNDNTIKITTTIITIVMIIILITIILVIKANINNTSPRSRGCRTRSRAFTISLMLRYDTIRRSLYSL